MSDQASTAELAAWGDAALLDARIDRLALDGDWEGLLELRDLCRVALERGHQLWPVAARAEYRLALEAPARWAGAMCEPGAGRFAPGPLAEVAATTHSWTELSPYVPAGPAAAHVAHERVLRGEDLTSDDSIDRSVMDIPLVLQRWEPAYALAEYEPNEARFPAPSHPSGTSRAERSPLPAPGGAVEDREVVEALAELARTWTVESNGRAEAVAVEGTAAHAVGAFGLREAALVQVSPAEALSHIAWTAASGGAYGRRRGMAAGRFAAWWAAAALCGMTEDWPVAPDELGLAIGELRWFLWDAGVLPSGWSLRLAVDDPADGLAWALTANDSA